MRLVLYTGKGGVGKTTTAAATAVCAARRGLRTLVLSADAAHSLGDVLGCELRGAGRAGRGGTEPVRVSEALGTRPRVRAPDGLVPEEPAPDVLPLDALELDARAEMERQWGRIRDWLVALFRYQGIDEVVAEELALLPGAEELTTLLAVEELVGGRRGRGYDLVVVDCAPTDAALRLVTLPDVAHGALRLLLRLQQVLSAVVTPLARAVVPVPLPDAGVFRDAERLLYRRLRALHRRLLDPLTSVRLVVTPERMVIDEARRTWTDLALFDVACDAVVMNRLLPEAAARERFFRDWGTLQRERLREVEALFAPLRVLPAPLQDDEVVGLARLAEHGRRLFARVEPDAVVSRAPRPRFRRLPAGQGYEAVLPLPHARAEDLDVAKIEGDLVVRTAGRRRLVPLPRRVAPLALASARLEQGALRLAFAPAGGADAPERR